EEDQDRNHEAVRVDDLVLDRVERAADPRIDPAEREGEGLRPGEVDPARDGGDLADADRAEGPPAAATDHEPGDAEADDPDRPGQVVEEVVLRHRVAEDRHLPAETGYLRRRR